MIERQRNKILSRWRAGASQRRIARDLGLSRNTVQRVLAEVDSQRAGVPASRRRRPQILDTFETVMRELLVRYPDLTGVRLYGGNAPAWFCRQLHDATAAAAGTAAQEWPPTGAALRDRTWSSSTNGLLDL